MDPRLPGLTDRIGRPLRDLRISVTDRCNFRCRYCMPREVYGRSYRFLPRAELLTFEEIARVTALVAQLGVRKVRLTGGEPLLRAQLPRLVRMLAGVAGVDDLTLTTNGSLLERHALQLKQAGLGRITVSLDALDETTFRLLSDADVSLQSVLDGIAAAERAGLVPINVNMVVRRGLNEHSILPMARHCRARGYVLRFIEYMDVGHTNGWRMDDVVPAADILARLDEDMPIEPVPPRYRGEVAARWRYRDGGGEVGVIASVSQPFCGDCTRLRLTADGQLFTCLFGSRGHDLRGALRAGATDDQLRELLRQVWSERDDRYSELRSRATGTRQLPVVDASRVEMSRIGG
ncbi:MAG TPA: GTP 3',8-cyclase MoaA [Candidatus Limnocylindrales bacterium]|nr:GTP 3',8-cyclase MoaA [Candidatus Limnocylindrales bacterium]